MPSLQVARAQGVKPRVDGGAGHARVYRHRAHACVAELADGAPDSARRYLARAYEVAPSPTTALNLAAALLSLDRPAEVRDLLTPLGAEVPLVVSNGSPVRASRTVDFRIRLPS